MSLMILSFHTNRFNIMLKAASGCIFPCLLIATSAIPAVAQTNRQTPDNLLRLQQLEQTRPTALPAPANNQQLPLSSPSSFSAPPPARSIDDYVIGAGDKLQVDVFRVPDYSGEYEVLVNGALRLPIVGSVDVAGLTLAQATNVISQAYSKRLRRPIIDVFLTEPRPLRVGIAGEVSQPGEYVLQREGTQFPSLVSALETAGGITQSADLDRVVVRRQNGTATPSMVVTNLKQLLETGDLRYSFELRDGDTILVPTRESFSQAESLQIASASFAADANRPLNIAVVGEVFRPGPYTVTGTVTTGDAGQAGDSGSTEVPPTVTRAIQVAGGIQPGANIRDVQIHRRTRNGQQQNINVNLWKLLTEGDITEDIILQEGDTVSVPKADDLLTAEVSQIASASFSPNTIRVNVVGEVDSPGSLEIPPNTPLSQGVLAAGGFTNRAKKGSVELIRLNPNGSVSRSNISIDFAEGIDEEVNPLLRNNDTIVVSRSASASFADSVDSIINPLGRAFSLFTLPASLFNIFD